MSFVPCCFFVHTIKKNLVVEKLKLFLITLTCYVSIFNSFFLTEPVNSNPENMLAETR